MLSSKYWAMSILYWRYHEKKAEGMSTEDSVGNGKYKGGESRTVLYICRKENRDKYESNIP